MLIPKPGMVIAGKYQLERLLAQGGMGAVWVAWHQQLEVSVALKLMDPALIASADARMRFEREARAAAQIDSAHVVAVRDYGVEDDTPYMVMELLQGVDLAQRLRGNGRLSLAEAASLTTQLARALCKVHDLGLVHRDLKPKNIFLARKDNDEVVKLLDFGVAKANALGNAGENTKTGMLLGSVHYIAPEQARSSNAADQRSDLWSFGVVLFRAVTGSLPFPGENTGDVIVKVCTYPIPVPSEVAPELPKELDGFFARALARAPDARFQSAKEMADAFSALVQASPWGSLAEPAPATPLQDEPTREWSHRLTAPPAPSAAWEAPSHVSSVGPGTFFPTHLTQGASPTEKRPLRFVLLGTLAVAAALVAYFFLGPSRKPEAGQVDVAAAPPTTLAAPAEKLATETTVTPQPSASAPSETSAASAIAPSASAAKPLSAPARRPQASAPKSASATAAKEKRLDLP